MYALFLRKSDTGQASLLYHAHEDNQGDVTNGRMIKLSLLAVQRHG